MSGESRHGARRSSHESGTQPESISYNDGVPNGSERLDEPDTPEAGIEETSSLLSKSSGSGHGDVPLQDGRPTADHHSQHVDVRGLGLLSKMKFYQLWLLLGLLTGIGLMTIK